MDSAWGNSESRALTSLVLRTIASNTLTMNFAASVVLVLTVLFLPGISSATSTQSTEAELKTINQDISNLKSRLNKLNKERSSTETRINKSEKEINTLKSEIKKIEKRLRDGQHDIKKLKDRQQVLKTKREQEKQRIAISLRSLYLSGNDDRIKLLLNQEDPEEVSRQLVYLNYFQKAQLKSIKAYEAIIVELESNKQQQLRINQEAQTKRDSLKQKNRSLEKQNQERQKLISKLSQQYRKSDKQLNALEKQRSELETILATLKSRAVNSRNPFNKMKGKLPWPVKGRLLFSYNERRPDTQMRWQGLFIAANSSQQAKAVHDGRVIFADWLRGYGLLIIVDHGEDYLTLYAHNQSLLKAEGDIVLAGEPLANIGKTGGQSTPGLYFEIRHKGTPQNPSSWLIRH